MTVFFNYALINIQYITLIVLLICSIVCYFLICFTILFFIFIFLDNPKSILSFANNYYGSNGTSIWIPEYNITNVLLSPAGKILNSFTKINSHQSNDENNIYSIIADSFLELRNQNKIVCINSEAVNIENCYDNYCLFDLENDPCETNNLIDKEAKIHIFHELRDILNNYRKQMIKFEKKLFDVHSHPKFWNNYWSPWINDTVENNGASNILNKNHYIFMLLIIFSLNFKVISILLL